MQAAMFATRTATMHVGVHADARSQVNDASAPHTNALAVEG